MSSLILSIYRYMVDADIIDVSIQSGQLMTTLLTTADHVISKFSQFTESPTTIVQYFVAEFYCLCSCVVGRTEEMLDGENQSRVEGLAGKISRLKGVNIITGEDSSFLHIRGVEGSICFTFQ